MEYTSVESNRAFFDELVRLQIELWNHVDERVASAHPVRLGSLGVLRFLDARGTSRVNDIAEDLVVTVGGTSKLIDRLESSGYCIRRANPDDRRSSLIELTESGRALLAAATVEFDAALAERLGESTDIAALTEKLRELR
jgi:MarR family transcriptional regulator, organic hydroperoxide resistance regulator